MTTIFDIEDISAAPQQVCQYFDEKLMDPKNWSYPTIDKGIDGIEIIDKHYGLWKDTKSGNNFGRCLGTDSSKVIEIRDDVEQNGIDCSQPPVYIDIDTCDIITGGHRKDMCGLLGMPGYMFVYVRCSDAWARKRFAKALNNERVFHCTNNNEDEVVEHIKFGINAGQLTSQQQIEDEIRMISNHSLSKAKQSSLVKKLISFIHSTGNTTVKLERYTAHNADVYQDFVARSTSPYVAEVLNNSSVSNFYINMENWGSRVSALLSEAAKTAHDSCLNIQASVDIPSRVESLDVKRKKIHSVILANLESNLDKVFMYKIANGCYPWKHSKCQHAFLAQDHHMENVSGGEFITIK